jgi:hypothetical protein
MREVDLDTRIRVHDDTVFRELAGEAVLLQLDAGMYYGLDGVGTRLWQMLSETGRLRDVFDAARQEFDVDPATLERDLLGLVSQLADKQLLVIE